MTFRRITQFGLVAGLAIFVALANAPDARAAGETVERYAGLFVIERHEGVPHYWYVHPETLERYSINSSNDFSRLLTNVGVSVAGSLIAAIPEEQDGMSLTATFAQRGKILLNTDDAGKAWYVDPLDLSRYYLHNGQTGFDVAQSLAVDIETDRLVEIPVTTKLGFNLARYESNQLQTDEGFDFDTYDTAFDLLRSWHLHSGEFTDADLFYGSLMGMAEATGDPYTQFYTPVESEEQQNVFEGDLSIEGIGALLSERDGQIYIVSVFSNTPAQAAGLESQDIILAANGTPISGQSVENAVSLIKGPAGTTVELTILRPRYGQTLNVLITRQKIDIPAIDGRVLDGAVAYFNFDLFTSDIYQEFDRLKRQLVTPQTKGIIMDMRNNIGGLTDSALTLADLWVPSQKLMMLEERADKTIRYLSPGRRVIPEIPTIILTNGETASAAEIFTSVLSHYDPLTTVLGTQTFGKGTGQNIIPFADGSSLKLTTFQWLMPDGSSVEGIGIAPDLTVELGTDYDNQLQEALQLLQ